MINQKLRDPEILLGAGHAPQTALGIRSVIHRYRESNGVRILATLRSLAINALRLDGIRSITEGIAALAHDIRGMLRLRGWRAPENTLVNF